MNLKTDKCRFCENDIESVIDFGRMPIANGFIKKEKNNFSINGKWITHTPTVQII